MSSPLDGYAPKLPSGLSRFIGSIGPMTRNGHALDG